MWRDRPEVEITTHPDKIIFGTDLDRAVEGPERTGAAPGLVIHRIDLGADLKTVQLGIEATDPMRGLAS